MPTTSRAKLLAVSVGLGAPLPSIGPPLADAGEVRGTVIAPSGDVLNLGLTALVESVAPGTVPNGLFYYVIEDVEPGAWFSLVGGDGYHPFMIGTAEECPGPDWEPGDLAHDPLGEDDNEWPDWWLFCGGGFPHLAIRFTGGEMSCGPGDEGLCCPGAPCTGVVPGPGSAVVYIVFGRPVVDFTYTES